MKIKDIDGVTHIILEENDKIKITTEKSYGEETLDVECKENCFNVFGNSSLINQIKGDGIIEKVYINPTLSSKEIIEKCDYWYDMFKKVFTRYRELLLTDEYRKEDISMYITFCNFYTLSGVNGKKINIDLNKNRMIVQEGLSIVVEKRNEEIYKYLFAKVLDYFISVNYEGIDVKNIDDDCSHVLKTKGILPILCILGEIVEEYDYYRIANSIIANHNVYQSSKQLIDNLKHNIQNQQLGSRFDESISYSERQYKYIVPNSTKGPTLEKKYK